MRKDECATVRVSVRIHLSIYLWNIDHDYGQLSVIN